ncbi:MAG: type II secretion system protein [Cyanobacteria bacterium J06554_6]
MNQVLRLLVRRRLSDSGYTLLELLVIVIMLGILMAITAPGWLGFLERQRVSAVRDNAVEGIRQAQNRARQTNAEWQYSIREGGDGYLEWAVHPSSSAPTNWTPLRYDSVLIDTSDTTLAGTGYYYIRFDFKGNLDSSLATLTFTSDRNTGLKRCVIASTLLGHFRLGEEHTDANSNGRYCY